MTFLDIITPLDRQRAAVMAACITGEDGALDRLLTECALPPQLAAVAGRVAPEVPDFLARFLATVDPQRDLTDIWSKFAIWLLRDVALPAITVDQWGCREAVEHVIRGYENGWQKDAAASAAARATYAAYVTYAADGATYAAARQEAWRRMADKLVELVT